MSNPVDNKITCDNCEERSPLGSRYCPNCGYPFNPTGNSASDLHSFEDRLARKIAYETDRDARQRADEFGRMFNEWFFKPHPWTPWKTYCLIFAGLYFAFCISMPFWIH